MRDWATTSLSKCGVRHKSNNVVRNSAARANVYPVGAANIESETEFQRARNYVADAIGAIHLRGYETGENLMVQARCPPLTVVQYSILRRQVATLLLCIGGGLLGATWAVAGTLDREVDFHISEGSLESALLQFSKQANVPITLAAHVTGNLQTPGLRRRLSVGVALETLLRHSGLSYAMIGDTVTIVRTVSVPPDPTTSTLHSASTPPIGTASQ